ncbi:hypothetical protein A2U01_0104680, partial [Trifolium medium]|nr:hypothetical protein [Trifolium medium]
LASAEPGTGTALSTPSSGANSVCFGKGT